jgi:hypothetical protein
MRCLSDSIASLYLPRLTNDDGLKATHLLVLPLYQSTFTKKTGMCFPTSETREPYCDPAVGANAFSKQFVEDS